MCFFAIFPSIVHLEFTASLASRIEIFRDRIGNHILVFFKYNFNRICLFYNFLIFIFYHFNHIKVKEHFYVFYYVFISYSFRKIEVLFKYRISFRMYIYCVQRLLACMLLFTFFGLSLIICSRLETFLMIFHFREIGFVFKTCFDLSNCRAYPLSILLFDARNRSAK